MKKKEFTCILCPKGCDIYIEYMDNKLNKIRGFICSQGKEYARQEMKNPLRTLTTAVLVKGGDNSLVSVKTDKPVPLKKVMYVMKVIKGLKVDAPINIGDVLIERPADIDCNIIATREVININEERRERQTKL